MKKTLAALAVAGAFAAGLLIQWDHEGTLLNIGDVVDQLVGRITDLEDQLSGIEFPDGWPTDPDTGEPLPPEEVDPEEVPEGLWQELMRANRDAAELKARVQEAIANIDGVEWPTE